MIIVSHIPRHFQIGANATQITKDMGKETAARLRAQMHGTITLLPGRNDVSSSEWAAVEASKLPVVQHYLDLGKNGGLVVIRAESPKDLNIGDAIALVGDMNDPVALEDWLANETRAPVQKALRARRTELEKLLAPETNAS